MCLGPAVACVHSSMNAVYATQRHPARPSLPLSGLQAVGGGIGAPSPRGRGGHTDAILLLADSAPAARALVLRVLLNIVMVLGMLECRWSRSQSDRWRCERRGCNGEIERCCRVRVESSHSKFFSRCTLMEHVTRQTPELVFDSPSPACCLLALHLLLTHPASSWPGVMDFEQSSTQTLTPYAFAGSAW